MHSSSSSGRSRFLHPYTEVGTGDLPGVLPTPYVDNEKSEEVNHKSRFGKNASAKFVAPCSGRRSETTEGIEEREAFP